MANTNALFISEARLKSLTAVHENVEPDDLMPYVVQAQDIYLQDVLGTKLFNSLKALIVAGTALNAYQLTLIEDYISPTIANYSLNPSSEESLNTGFSEMKYLRESVLDTAQFYMTRTQEYLCDNSSQFPDFTQPGNDGMMPNPRSPYNSGIVMPHSTGCGCGSVTLCNC